MNTKNLFFICFFVLLTTTAATVVSFKQKSVDRVAIAQNVEIPAAQELPAIDLVPFEHTEHASDSKHKHPDDDGHFHYFHFERMLQYRRGRVACIFCAKTILIVIHLAALLLAYVSLHH